MKTLILLSGGLDSATLLAQLVHEKHDIHAIQFGYGSTHQEAETEAAEQIAEYYGVGLEQIELPAILFAGGQSSLLGQSSMPDESYRNLDVEGPSSTVVPFRNGIMIASAVAIANSRGFNNVAVAVHANDYAHWSYPDCSPEFIGAMSASIYTGTYHEIRLLAPFLWKTKADIVKLAMSFNLPAELTWSCYQGHLAACGVCPTCRERIAAFKEAGHVDPADYEIMVSWGNCKPWQPRLRGV
jgi:7-cyano-7-deazaguanine synthase